MCRGVRLMMIYFTCAVPYMYTVALAINNILLLGGL